MKFFHISDLHIGKRVNGFSMLEDQRYILQQMLELAEQEQPDGVWIAGDLYDRSMPSAEAVELADWFLSQLALRKVPVWVISGNHDSAERVAYAARMLERSGVYVSRLFDGTLQGYCAQKQPDGSLHITSVTEAEQRSGNRVYIWLLPYLRPVQVRRFFPEQEIDTTQQAVEAVLHSATLPHDGPNILLMHQFLTGAAVCDSEELSIGGLDQVDASAVRAFDYVALGHLHRPQNVGSETVRYCGSPLKYSFSEAGHQKSVTVVEIDTEPAQGSCQISVSALPLIPRLDLREIRGPFETLLTKEVYGLANREDYLHITLTDQDGILDALGKLREVYPNIMKLDFERTLTGGHNKIEETEILVEEKTPQELFEEFFKQQNGRKMSSEQRERVDSILRALAREH